LATRIENLNEERAQLIQKNAELSDQIGDKATARDLQQQFKVKCQKNYKFCF